MNTNFKLYKKQQQIFNNILTQMQYNINWIIYYNHVRFIPGMQDWLNTGKSINMAHHFNWI